MTKTHQTNPEIEKNLDEYNGTEDELKKLEAKIKSVKIKPTKTNVSKVEKTDENKNIKSSNENKNIESSVETDVDRLTRSGGVFNGPSGRETWYNLNMKGVVKIMRDSGYKEDKYPYHVRRDGVKMLGPYVMVAANLSIRPRGTILETSLGKGIVCDTGGFVRKYPRGLDIATNW